MSREIILFFFFSLVDNAEKNFCGFFISGSKEVWSWLSDFGMGVVLGSVGFQNCDNS